MLSSVKVFAGKNVSKFYKHAHTFSQRSLLNEIKYGLCSSSYSKIRFYGTPRASIHEDVSQNRQIMNNMKEELIYIDSLLKRNFLVGGTSIKKITSQLKHISASGKEGQITSQQVLFLLQTCGVYISKEPAKTNIEMVTDIWNVCEQLGLPLDISHHNALLEIYLENEHKFSPLEYLSSLEKKKIQPNQITYNRLLARFCQEGDIEGATSILQMMKDKGFPATESTFNFLIMGNARARDLEGARNILEIMRNNDCPPSFKTYATLLEGYAENGDVEGMKQLLAKCEEEEVVFPYDALLRTICALPSNVYKENEDLKQMIFSKIQTASFDRCVFEATMLRLFDGEHDELAFEILQTFDPKGRVYQMKGMLKHFASSCHDISRLAKLCDEMVRLGMNMNAFEIALETLLLDKEFNLALDFLQQMKMKKIPVKDHYFYPLVCHYGKVGLQENAFKLVELMNEMDVNISEEFFSVYFIPNVITSGDVKDLGMIYTRVRNQAESNTSKIYNAVVSYLLLRRELQTAGLFVKRFRRSLRQSIGKQLAAVHYEVDDVESTVSIMRQLLPIANRRGNDDPITENSYSGLNNFFTSLIEKLKKSNQLESKLIPLLTRMTDDSLGFPSSVEEHLASEIGDSMTDEIKALLSRLSDPSLSLIGKFSLVEELRMKIQIAEQEEKPTHEFKIRLLVALAKEGTVEEMEQFLVSLKSEGVTVPPAALMVVLDKYLNETKLPEAQDLFHEILNNYPEFRMHAHKIINYALALVKENRFQDAAKSLQMASPENGDWTSETSPDLQTSSYYQRLSNLLSHIAAENDLTSLHLIQEILISRGFAPPSIVMSPLLKYYLKENNLEEAFSVFKRLSEEYEITPCCLEMLKAAIEQENKDTLQNIMDINTKIHGDMNSWYNLAFALIDLERLGPAEKVFRTPGLRALPGRLYSRCEFLLNTGRISQLEILVKATKVLYGVNRPKLYEYLLNGYISVNDPQKALEVWVSMQEENVIPTERFLSTLADFLRSKGMEVPFAAPKQMLPQERPPPPVKTTQQDPKTPPLVKDLINAFNEQNILKIQATWDRIKNSETELSKNLHYRYIGSLLKFDKVEEALAEIKQFIIKNEFLPQNMMKTLLSQLASAKDFTTIEFLGKYLDEQKKRRYSYNYFVGLAYINAGKTEEYLNAMLENIKSSESIPDNIGSLGATPGFLIKIISDHAHLYTLVEQCADALKEKGNVSIFSNLWDIHTALGNVTKAEEIYDKYLKNETNLAVQTTCTTCFKNRDTKKLDAVLKILDQESGKEAAKGALYSSYIDILYKSGHFQEALNVLENSLKCVRLEHYKFRALESMKKEFERNNLTFPYDLSVLKKEKDSSSSSSSSSDD